MKGPVGEEGSERRSQTFGSVRVVGPIEEDNGIPFENFQAAGPSHPHKPLGDFSHLEFHESLRFEEL